MAISTKNIKKEISTAIEISFESILTYFFFFKYIPTVEINVPNPIKPSTGS